MYGYTTRTHTPISGYLKVSDVDDMLSFAKNDEATVVVPETLLGLSDEDIHLLRATRSRYGNDGISAYLQTVNTICQLLNINC